jgi:hypothetical protein
MGVNAIGKLLQDSQRMRLTYIRAVFWAGLLDHQRDMTFEQAKGLLHQIDPMDAIDVTMKAFSSSFPDAPEEQPQASPQKPSQDLTGSAS